MVTTPEQLLIRRDSCRTLQPAGKRSLAILHVSPRYGKVDAKVLGLQRSRNMKQKIAQGRYFAFLAGCRRSL